MKKKILIIGSGGREHALGWKIKQSPLVEKIYFAPGNAGTLELGENINIHPKQINNLLHFANEYKIDLTLVGPEAPLILGIADLFIKKGLKIIGPSKKASQIEGSKIFAKKLMKKYGIPTAEFVAFDDFHEVKKYLKTAKYPLVVKADGLTAGKGVFVCATKKEAEHYSKHLMVDKIFDSSGEKIIIEECLFGQEVSFTVLTDGNNFVSFLPSQDHKRLLDNDLGPNTGGMGAYAPVPFVNQDLITEIEKDIIVPTIKALMNENCLYQGILYPGLIITPNGPKVLEFNCRFGDPEIQPLMMMLESDLVTVLLSIIEKNINQQKLIFKNGASVCVVLASDGYPDKYIKGKEIIYSIKIIDHEIQIFHAGTKHQNGKILTNGGRVLGVTSYGKNMRDILKKTYSVINNKEIFFDGMQYRKDIGARCLDKDNKYDIM